GFQTTDAIRREEMSTGRHIPIVALTAHAIEGDRQRCFRAGMDGHVSKPIRPEELKRVLDSLQSGREVPVVQEA
ncbi:MAG TPA: response regulator, partial [Bryobacteraceae bacterium]|nr:response regulator [Bryobacteraceae bacterium]